MKRERERAGGERVYMMEKEIKSCSLDMYNFRLKK